jgi:hypothetical protein
MATKLSIWNRALARIGEQRLAAGQDVTPTTEPAKQCALAYDDCVAEALGAGGRPWTFALKQAALTAAPAGTAFTGWTYVYQLPAGCITPVALLPEGTRLAWMPSDMRLVFDTRTARVASTDTRFLVTDAEGGSGKDFEALEYVAVVDEDLWPSAFVDAVVHRLAAELALVLRKEPQLASGLMNAYAAALSRAASTAWNGRQEDQ